MKSRNSTCNTFLNSLTLVVRYIFSSQDFFQVSPNFDFKLQAKEPRKPNIVWYKEKDNFLLFKKGLVFVVSNSTVQ